MRNILTQYYSPLVASEPRDTRYTYTIITLQYAYCAQHGTQQFVRYVFFFSFS